MKKLIIENNLPDFILKKGDNLNIPLDNPQTIIGENYNFEIFLLESLKESLISQQYEAIVVSLNLNSTNCLNFNGLDVAYTLRLSSELYHQFVPIIILGSLSLEIILRLNPKANILLTPGVYYKNLSTEADEFLDNKNFINISIEGHNFFLERIEIKPPSNYQTHHSIANEWGMLQWAEALNIDKDSSLENIKLKVEGLLFYKYLKCKYPYSSKFENPPSKIYGDGNVLYIDDEWEMGWDYVLEKFFMAASKLTFRTFKYQFKSQTKEKILEDCEKEIRNLNTVLGVNVILLDLRLSDSDFSSKPNELSGFRLLQKIKGYFNDTGDFVEGINPGIQVIIFTASNKVWNLTQLLAAGADGFVLKVAPELSTKESYTKNSLKSFVDQLTICVSRTFLTQFYESIKTIKKDIKKSLWNDKLSQDQQHEITAFEGFAISMLYTSFDIFRNITIENQKSKLRSVVLFLYQILEDYVKLTCVYQVGNKKQASIVIKSDGTSIEVFGPDKRFDGNIFCNIFFKTGRFHYQSEKSKNTPISVEFKRDTFKTGVNAKTQISETSLFKMINVFKEKFKYSELECNNLIELTYLRSNLCGHVTGNIDSNIRDIDKNDITKLLNIIKDISK